MTYFSMQFHFVILPEKVTFKKFIQFKFLNPFFDSGCQERKSKINDAKVLAHASTYKIYYWLIFKKKHFFIVKFNIWTFAVIGLVSSKFEFKSDWFVQLLNLLHHVFHHLLHHGSHQQEEIDILRTSKKCVKW